MIFLLCILHHKNTENEKFDLNRYISFRDFNFLINFNMEISKYGFHDK